MMNIVYNVVRSMFGRPMILHATWRLLFRLYTPNRAMLPISCSFGAMKEPPLYMHCSRGYLCDITCGVGRRVNVGVSGVVFGVVSSDRGDYWA